MGEPEGVGDDRPRAPVVLAGEMDMAEGGGGEEPRKADLNPSRGAAMMFWVVGIAEGEGGPASLLPGCWGGASRGESRGAPLRLGGGSLAGEGESCGWEVAGGASRSAMDVRARESAMSWGESCFEDVRPSFFEEDWPWPIVVCARGGGASDSGWLYRRELVNTATNDRGDTPSGPGTRRRTFSPITGQVIL